MITHGMRPERWFQGPIIILQLSKITE
jgi:hypothetical protein